MANKLTEAALHLASMTEEEILNFAANIKGDVDHIKDWVELRIKQSQLKEKNNGEENQKANTGAKGKGAGKVGKGTGEPEQDAGQGTDEVQQGGEATGEGAGSAGAATGEDDPKGTGTST